MSNDRPGNPLARQLDLLLTGYGYNFYNEKNKMRADDLLVRHQAAESLGHAANALGALEGEYQRHYIPPGTREQPFPPPERLERLRDVGQARDRLLNLAADIRAMPVPTQDRTWWRFRGERALLESLLHYDRALIGEATELCETVQGLRADAWHTGEPYAGLIARIEQLAAIVRDRRQLLRLPG